MLEWKTLASGMSVLKACAEWLDDIVFLHLDSSYLLSHLQMGSLPIFVEDGPLHPVALQKVHQIEQQLEAPSLPLSQRTNDESPFPASQVDLVAAPCSPIEPVATSPAT